jgi:hypothetical protein
MKIIIQKETILFNLLKVLRLLKITQVHKITVVENMEFSGMINIKIDMKIKYKQ